MASKSTEMKVQTEEKGKEGEKCKAQSESKIIAKPTRSKDSCGHSEVDGWLFRKSEKKGFKRDSIPVGYVESSLDAQAESYDMDHKRRGVALIFNHVHFKNMSTRKGTIKDCADLKAALQRLEFEVRVYEDPAVQTISAVLKSVAAEDHTDADCLLVTVMSHGESGLVHSMDSLYPVDMLWSSFTGDQCPTLVGKPKLFFVQACRGSRLDEGIGIMHRTDSRATAYSIPTFADIMVAYSTYDGFYSWRNPDVGAWFIQALCEEFNRNGSSRDLLSIMTFVNRHVALEYESYVPYNEDFHAKKQIPSIVSMLTRLVYFKPKKSTTIQKEDDHEITLETRVKD